MNKIKAIAFALSLVGASSAMANNILVSELPWGQNRDVTNMTNVFGAGNFTTYASYGVANAGSIFTASNRFVMLEGGANTDIALSGYLTANSATILGWVNGGGSLLIQSAGWNTGFTFGAGTFTYGAVANSCGTLTGAGVTALTGTPAAQCGSYLAHDTISGAGLTNFMNGDTTGTSIIAGLDMGSGYLMYSGLTNSQFHSSGNGLVDAVIRYTADQAGNNVPEPGSLALLGLGLAGIAAARRRKQI